MGFGVEKQRQEKDKLQEEGVRLFQQYDRVALLWPTGASKTLGALKCADTLENPSILLLVAEISHINNWLEEFKKWDKEHLLSSIVIQCYASLSKHIDKEYDLVIMDEVHHLSKLREVRLDTIRAKKMIALSATVSPEVWVRMQTLGEFQKSEVTMAEAIERGILPAVEIDMIMVELDNLEKKHSVPKRKERLTDKQYVDYLQDQIMDVSLKLDFATGKPREWMERRLMTLGGQRKRAIGEAKTQRLLELLNTLEDKRIMTFCASTEQCKLVGGKLAIHSGRTKKVNLETLEKFNNGETDKLFAIKMGREGLNLNNLDHVIVTQLSTGKDKDGNLNGLETVQIIGRSTRSLYPHCTFLIAKDTVDEKKWLPNALAAIPNQKINYIT